MVNALYGFFWFLFAWIWGDWRNWKKYYSTILFFIIGDLLYLYLLSDYYPMWTYTPPPVDESINITNTHVSLSIILIKYPATVLIYLSKFPKEDLKNQLLYIFLWVLIYSINEMIDINLNFIKYSNGWNFWWSMIFNIVMFSILWIHHKKAPLAWGLSAIFIVFLWIFFDVPDTVFR